MYDVYAYVTSWQCIHPKKRLNLQTPEGVPLPRRALALGTAVHNGRDGVVRESREGHQGALAEGRVCCVVPIVASARDPVQPRTQDCPTGHRRRRGCYQRRLRKRLGGHWGRRGQQRLETSAPRRRRGRVRNRAHLPGGGCGCKAWTPRPRRCLQHTSSVGLHAHAHTPKKKPAPPHEPWRAVWRRRT